MITTEQKRIFLQNKLDSTKTQGERNKLGQFATPTELAIDILEYSKRLLPGNIKINFFDPAIGTGSFYSALISVYPNDRIKQAYGYEIDSHYAEHSIQLWQEFNLKIQRRTI